MTLKNYQLHTEWSGIMINPTSGLITFPPALSGCPLSLHPLIEKDYFQLEPRAAFWAQGQCARRAVCQHEEKTIW